MRGSFTFDWGIAVTSKAKKENIASMAWYGVLSPLGRHADPLSWILLLAFAGMFVWALILRADPSSDWGKTYQSYYPVFWYVSWGFLVLAVIGPILTIRRQTRDIPLGVLLGSGAALLLTFLIISVITLLESGKVDAVTAILSAAAAAMVVAVGWVVQNQSTARNARRTHTFNVLIQSRLSKEYQEQVKRRCEVYWAGVPVEAADADLISKSGLAKHLSNLEQRLATAISQARQEVLEDVRAQYKAEEEKLRAKHESLQGVKYLLNFYEFICVGIKLRELDEAMLRGTLGDIAVELYDATAHVRAYCRESQPDALSAMDEIIGDRWKQPESD
jgi:hypothetical protein